EEKSNAETDTSKPATDARPADEKSAAPAETEPKVPGEEGEPKPEGTPPAGGDAQLPLGARPGLPRGDLSFVGGTRAELTFPSPIKYSALEDMIKEKLEKLELAKPGVEIPFRLNNPKFTPGSKAAFSNWTLEIKLPPEPTESLLKAIRGELEQTPVFPS